MKRLFILIPVLAVLTMSCNKAQLTTETPDQMTLQPYTQVQSRAIATGTVVPTDRTMIVSADVQSSTGGSGNFFTNRTFSYSSSVWVPTITTYWPVAGTLDILAFAYKSSDISLTPTWTNATQVVLTNSNFTTDDVLMGAATDADRSHNTVAFQHCLSQVKFRANATVSDVITIKQIDIYAKKGATLTITKSANSSSLNCNTALSGDPVANTVFSSTQVLSGTLTSIGSPLLLPVQTPTKVRIKYTLTTGTGASQTVSPEMWVEKTLSTAIARGSAYTYDISFTLRGMELTASLTEWTGASGGTVSI